MHRCHGVSTVSCDESIAACGQCTVRAYLTSNDDRDSWNSVAPATSPDAARANRSMQPAIASNSATLPRSTPGTHVGFGSRSSVGASAAASPPLPVMSPATTVTTTWPPTPGPTASAVAGGAAANTVAAAARDAGTTSVRDAASWVTAVCSSSSPRKGSTTLSSTSGGDTTGHARLSGSSLRPRVVIPDEASSVAPSPSPSPSSLSL